MNTTNIQMVEHLFDRLTQEEQITVIEQLARRLRQKVVPRSPRDLYGIWQNRFPTDFDVDSALKEIRTSWENEWTSNPRA